MLLYRNSTLRRYQYFSYPDWPGGIYMSPGLSGSRSGGIVAAAWAAMLSLGEQGYMEIAERIFETAATILTGVAAMPELEIFGDPTFIIAFRGRGIDIYHVNDFLISKGWRLNALQLPPGLHFCVTRPNTADGVAEAFLADLRDAVEYAKTPGLGPARSGALYGLGGSPEGKRGHRHDGEVGVDPGVLDERVPAAPHRQPDLRQDLVGLQRGAERPLQEFRNGNGAGSSGPTATSSASSASAAAGSSAAGSAWARLPPIVPRLRIGVCATSPTASATRGAAIATSGERSSSASRVMAPTTRTSPSRRMPLSPATLRRSMR